MKRFFEIMQKDIFDSGFTTFEVIVFGVIAPVAFIALCVVAEFISSLY